MISETISAHPRYDENAQGAFYSEKDLCIACRLPEAAAPDLIGFREMPEGEEGASHCFFQRQPTTSDEVSRAIKALQVCCCGTLRYAGNELDVLQKLRDAGLESQCDIIE